MGLRTTRSAGRVSGSVARASVHRLQERIEFSGPLDEVVEGGSVFGRAFLTSESMYLLVVMGFESEVRVDDPSVSAFFNSFDFLKAALR